MSTPDAFKVTSPVNRLHGEMPRIGIRPTIDGRRRGVRESLEVQTMNMAKAAAELISSNLRYPNGMPVECVIADQTIGGAAEAAMCAEKFKNSHVMVTQTVTPSWCYGAEKMDIDPHRASRRGLSRRRARRPCPEGLARFRHLRP